MADGRDHGKLDRMGVERTPRRRPPYPARASQGRMSGDRLYPITRTAWEQADDLRRHLRLQFNVPSAAPLGVALAPTRPHIVVSETFLLGSLERLLLNQDPLPLIAPPGTAKADYHRPEIARGLRAPGQGRVAGGKEHQVIEVRARHTHRAGVLHRQPSALLVATQRTAPVAQCRDHQQLRRPSLPFRQRHSPPLLFACARRRSALRAALQMGQFPIWTGRPIETPPRRRLYSCPAPTHSGSAGRLHRRYPRRHAAPSNSAQAISSG